MAQLRPCTVASLWVLAPHHHDAHGRRPFDPFRGKKSGREVGGGRQFVSFSQKIGVRGSRNRRCKSWWPKLELNRFDGLLQRPNAAIQWTSLRRRASVAIDRRRRSGKRKYRAYPFITNSRHQSSRWMNLSKKLMTATIAVCKRERNASDALSKPFLFLTI